MFNRGNSPGWIKALRVIAIAFQEKNQNFVENFYLRFRSAKFDDYTRLQRRHYLRSAKKSKVVPGQLVEDHVVGSWQEHDAWKDYETYLMKYVLPQDNFLALDFGCGPGRNIRTWSDWFQRIDGADISNTNLSNATVFLRDQIPANKSPNLFLTDGSNCGDAKSDAYNFVFSTVTLQHICSHAVRYAILQDMFRILRPGGRVSLQMGYGSPSPKSVGYFENNFSATATNRGCDTEISTPDAPKKDLEEIGFANFEYWIRPVGPGDFHPNWIFFTATKPSID